jgi:hypothetical protein
MSDDEFDDLDDLANLEGVDWDSLLSGIQPPDILLGSTHELQVQVEPAAPSDYSFDEIDQEVFAEVDTFEQNNIQVQARPLPVTGNFTIETERYTRTKLTMHS